MLPITLDISEARIVLAGNGPAVLRRLRYLEAGGVGCLTIFSPLL